MRLNLFPLQCLIAGVVAPVALSLRLAPLPVKINMTWSDAQTYCRSSYYDLAVAKTPNDWVKLTNTLAKHGMTGPIWMGLDTNFNTWRWSMNELPLNNITLRMWGGGEPDNSNGHEWCVAIDKYGLWWDADCRWAITFVCYDAVTKTFVGVNIPSNWSIAQTYCRQHHTDLASSLTVSDNKQITQITSALGFSWFGLYRDDWKWVDGTKVDHLLWQDPLPDNAVRFENCGTFNGGKLADKQCTNNYYVVCDLIPVVEDVVKLWVKADESVLDPAVQAAILQQLRQKVNANFTVSWRLQPDRKVFHKVPVP